MKKNLKIASLFIIAITFMFGFTNYVKAASACDGIKCATGVGHGTVTVHGNSDVYSTSSFRGTSTTHKVAPGLRPYSYAGVSRCAGGSCNSSALFNVFYDNVSALFCLDAHKDGNSTLNAWRFLGAGDQAKGVEAYDQALLYILSQGSQGFVSNSEYFSKLIAIRAITATWGYFGNAGYNYQYRRDLYAVYGTTANFLSNSYTLTLYNQVNELLNGNLSKVSSIRSSGQGYYFTGGAIDTGHGLYNGALQAAVNYLVNSNSKATVTGSYTPQVKEENTNDTGVTVDQDVIHTYKIKGFEKDGASVIINQPTLDQDKKHTGVYNPTITSIKVNDKELGASAVGQNIIPLSGISFKEEVTVQVTVHLKGQKSDELGIGAETMKCGQQPIKYHLKVDYDAKTQISTGGKLGIIWYSGSQYSQRYVGIENRATIEGEGTTTGGKGSFEDTPEVQLIPPCDCTDLKKSCEVEAEERKDLDGPACQELKESNCGDCSVFEIECDVLDNEEACDNKYEYCEVTCKTDVDEFDCCDYSGDEAHLIVEGDNIPVNIKGPDEPYGCFVKGVDKQSVGTASSTERNYNALGYSKAAGVKDDTEKNTYTLTQNKYCLVSCKEDYAMSLPTARQVNSGRYFTFKAQVNGTKTCYTNTIDVDSFNTDVEQLVEDMEVAINEYIKYTYTKNNLKIYESKYNEMGGGCDSCGTVGYLNGVVEEYSDIPQYKFTTRIINGLVSVTVSDGAKISYNWTTDGIKDGGYSGSCDTVCGSVCCGSKEDPCGTKCDIYTLTDPGRKGTIENVEQGLNPFQENWRKKYESLAEKLKQLQTEYQNCSNDSWSSSLHYEPEIYYDYEENYITEFYNNYGEMIETKGEETKDRWYCEPGKLKAGKYEKGDCQSNTTSNNAKTVQNLTCTITGTGQGATCTTAALTLPLVGYVSESSKITAEYKPEVLFYNVHPSGEILDKEKANGRDDVTPVTDKEGTGGLPVSLNTERGIYKYTINIQKLGEFYQDDCKNSDCELGRLIGGGDKAVINEKDYEKIVKNNIGSYSCAYLVNIKNTEGWVCDFDQECTDDCISDCIGPTCEEEICTGVNCISDCVGIGCIYDVDAGSSFTQRTVTLSTLFPNGTTSPNWDRSKPKAEASITEIEELQNAVYEQEPILSIKLTGTAAREIQKYNESNIPDGDNNTGSWNLDLETLGGYSNQTLDCYALGDYKEVACYSSFIDKVLEGEYGSIVNDNSLIANSDYRTHGDVNGSKGEYFEKWTGTVSEDDMVGPAWK